MKKREKLKKITNISSKNELRLSLDKEVVSNLNSTNKTEVSLLGCTITTICNFTGPDWCGIPTINDNCGSLDLNKKPLTKSCNSWGPCTCYAQ